MPDRLPGSVYVTPDGQSGIFLDPEVSAALLSIIARVENEPTIAGPELDLTVLEELRQVLATPRGAVRENESPIILSEDLATYLQLILFSTVVKASLAPKLRFRCKHCTLEFTEDPEHLRRRQAEAKARERNAQAGDYFRFEGQHRAHNRPGELLAAYTAMSRPHQSADLICSNCRGDRFDVRDVTYCPGCGALRREMLLLRCPDCPYDYQQLLPGPIFQPSIQAIEDFRVYWKQTAILNTVTSLWPTTGPGQLSDLLAEISPDEKLIGLCNYSAIDGRKRHVIVLFTSEKVVWTARRLIAFSDGARRAWDQIREISAADGAGQLRITLANGSVVHFSGFAGAGADMSVGDRSFGPEEIRRTSRRMLPAGN